MCQRQEISENALHLKFENLKFRMEIQEDSTDGNLIEVNDAGRLIPIGPEYDKHEYVYKYILIKI